MSEERPLSNIPIPDPSLITTAQIDKSRTELKADYTAAIATLERILETRLNAMDKADNLFMENLNRVPTLLDREVMRLTIIIESKYEHNREIFQEMFRARDLAIETAKISITERLDAMNEFREQLTSQAAMFITRDEHSVVMEQIAKLQLQAQADVARFVTRDEIGTLRGIADRQEVANLDVHSNMTARISSLEAKFYIGGAGIVIVVAVMQLILNYLKIS